MSWSGDSQRFGEDGKARAPFGVTDLVRSLHSLSLLTVTCISLNVACQSHQDAAATAPAGAPSVSVTASARRAPAPAGFPPPLPGPPQPPGGKLLCKDDPYRDQYWIRVEGDGPVQLLKEGKRVSLEGGRHAKWCSAHGYRLGEEVRASACASRDQLTSCLFLHESHARYYDRTGTQHDLPVRSLSAQALAEVVDGKAALESVDGKLKLAVSFHVGPHAWLEHEDLISGPP